ncbi:MAG TPA: hypothetical protein VJN89_18620 [Candidatus Acidoferrum sp.]|nr:hypothetical protein [Candidatus Acidoferrum sp.]
MLVREYKETDLGALRAIHAAQGFDYALPDLRNPLFVTKLVLSDAKNVNVAPGFSPASSRGSTTAHSASARVEAQPANSSGVPTVRDAPPTETVSKSSDRILGAALLRLTAEAYLLLDPRVGTPRERWQWLLALHEAARRDAWQRGLEDVHAWLPPPIAKKFGRRLERLGWCRDDAWTPYCTRLGGV